LRTLLDSLLELQRRPSPGFTHSLRLQLDGVVPEVGSAQLQLVLGDPFGRGVRQHVTKLPVARHLEPSEPINQIGRELDRLDGTRLSPDDVRLGLLAHVLVGDGGHRALDHIGCVASAVLTSTGATFSPPRLIIFLRRPRREMNPINDAARRSRADVIQVDLNGQFRCMGSAGYIQWVERFLGITPGGPITWDPSDDFKVQVFTSPDELEQWVRRKHGQRYTARLTAGFCWPWSDPTPDGYLIDDVEIGEWRRPWNAKPNKRVKDAPAASYWASDQRGVDQVGCIYTAQGFEYDFGGVILGPDFVWRNGEWTADSSQHADTVTRKAGNFDELVRNVYKVLLTRSLRGCGIYSTDAQTLGLLEDLIP
jgi:DUF2075 family protein